MLGEWNRQLIRDEGHRNPMNTEELTARMAGWLGSGYQAVVFAAAGEPVGYAVYLAEPDTIYLRHFFIRAEQRRRGCGRAGFQILRDQVWPEGVRLSVNVLCRNAAGVAFWHAMGYANYCLTLEMMPGKSKDGGGCAAK